MNEIVLFNSFKISIVFIFLFLISYLLLILFKNKSRKYRLYLNEQISVKKLRILSSSSFKNIKFKKSVFCVNIIKFILFPKKCFCKNLQNSNVIDALFISVMIFMANSNRE